MRAHSCFVLPLQADCKTENSGERAPALLVLEEEGGPDRRHNLMYVLPGQTFSSKRVPVL